MLEPDIRRQRLNNQGITSAPFQSPEEAVSWLGAVQAQDFAAAKWALGQRVQGSTEATLEQAFNAGAILRTHVLRPTWHFVTPADIRWMLALTAPRVHQANNYQYRRLELDQEVIRKSHAVLENALRGGRQLTRAELDEILQGEGIVTGGLRSIYMIMWAELDGIICSGARRGKQFTYALLEERAPRAKNLTRDEALAELVKRYFQSRGPATLRDFAWWSGLTLADARDGLEMMASRLESVTNGEQTYWFIPSPARDGVDGEAVYLLPNFDEYVVGYTDRGLIYDASHDRELGSRASILANHTIVLDGRIVGIWRRTLAAREVTLETNLFARRDGSLHLAITQAAERYGAFLQLPAVITE